MKDIFSIFRSNNPKKDPYWDFEPENHFRPELDKGEFYRLTGFDFGWFVLEPISIFVKDEEHEIERSKSLSYGQKALYFWWYIDAQVTNGGFLQFYYNGYGHYVPTILKSLAYIGDNKMVEIIQSADNVYKAHKKSIDNARENDLFPSETYAKLDKFSDLDSLYYEVNEKTMSYIEKYVRRNPNEFCLDEDGNEFDATFSGDCKTYYENGLIKESFYLDKGLVSGEFDVFYENGNIKERIQYLNGIQTGEKEEFDRNGIILYRSTKDSLKNQFLYQWFYGNGNPKKLEHRQIDKNEQIGEYKEWFENGQLSRTCTYISNGEREGPWIEFYPDGSKKVEAEFRNGEFLLQNSWTENGEQTVINGTGLYIHYYFGFGDFNKRYEEEYKDYKRHGTQKTFNDDVLSLYQEIENGVSNGYTRTYYKNGKIKEETLYEKGVVVSEKIFPEEDD